MKNIFGITNKYNILLTPLILFVLLSNIYMVSCISNVSSKYGLSLLLLPIIFVTFLAGWLKMIKSAVSNNLVGEPNLLIKEFPTGVGEYFLPVLATVLIIAIINFMALFSLFTFGTNILGDIHFLTSTSAYNLSTVEGTRNFLNTLSADQVKTLFNWSLCILGVSAIISFLLMLYLPALFFKTKNPLFALWKSLRDLFSRHFLKNLAVFMTILFSYVILTLLQTIFAGNIFINFILLFVFFYYLTVVAVGIFYYYYHVFIEPYLGQNIDTYV